MWNVQRAAEVVRIGLRIQTTISVGEERTPRRYSEHTSKEPVGMRAANRTEFGVQQG
jgi:hypothetical protein